MKKGTAGSLLLDDVLPEDLRGRTPVLDKKGTTKLLADLARQHPDRYAQVLLGLTRLAHRASYWTGGQSFGLSHLLPARRSKEMLRKLEADIEAVWTDPSLSSKEKSRRSLLMTDKMQDAIEKSVYEESLAEGNPLALQVQSGSRGNKTNLRSLRGADLLYVDHHDQPIPVPVLRSYAEGLRPHEYFASTFGDRKGLVETKLSVADTGYFGKQLVQAAHRLLVTADDDDDAYDESNPRGLPVDTSDRHNLGALLAHPIGGYPRNTVLTPEVLSDLENRGFDRVLARSPLVGGPRQGGVFARDVGVRERGGLAPVGDFVGIAAANALTEGLTQGTLQAKHTGGVAGAGKNLSAFQSVDAIVQVPSVFPGGAAHAEVDGKVSAVAPAPQGGHYVVIGDTRHHVVGDQEVLVKPGDEVEAGDVLSNGAPNPAKVVEHKGVGEGRRYFTKTMLDTYRRFGMSAHRRNVELVARGLVDHVRLTDEAGDYSPDDVVSYAAVERSYAPREGHEVVEPRRALGRYLERPVLHYTIGTKVRPSVLRELAAFGVGKIAVHRDPPPFVPEMVRGMENLTHDPDWMTRFLGSYVQKGLLKGVARADVSDERGTSYVPSLARAVDFDRYPWVQGWKPPPPAPRPDVPVEFVPESVPTVSTLPQAQPAPSVRASAPAPSATSILPSGKKPSLLDGLR